MAGEPTFVSMIRLIMIYVLQTLLTGLIIWQMASSVTDDTVLEKFALIGGLIITYFAQYGLYDLMCTLRYV